MKQLIAILFLSAIISCSKETDSKSSALVVTESVAALPVVSVTWWCYSLDEILYHVNFTADNLKTNDILSIYYQIDGENGWGSLDSIINIPHNEQGNGYGTNLRTFRVTCEGRIRVTVIRNNNVAAHDNQQVHCEECTLEEKKKPPCEGCAHQ